MKKTKLCLAFALISIVFSVLCFFFIIVVFLNSVKIIEKTEVYAYIIVSDHIGFDLNSSILAFGMVSPGGSATRNVVVDNKHNFPVRVTVVPDGEIGKFVVSQTLVITANQEKQVSISASVPEGTKYGNYTGSISIIFRKYLWKQGSKSI